MSAYCNNNPVKNADSNGLYAVAIIRTGESYYEDVFVFYYKNVLGYEVKDRVFSSRDDFVNLWNDLESNYYDEVILMAHGDPVSASFIFEQQEGIQAINDSDRYDARPFSDLEELNVKGQITLCTCYAAKQDANGRSIAQSIANRVNCKVVATDGAAYCGLIGISPEEGHRWYFFFAQTSAFLGRTAKILKGGMIMEDR